MGPCFKSYLSYKFDRPETIRDRAKMNLAGHRVRRLSGNYFEPSTRIYFLILELKAKGNSTFRRGTVCHCGRFFHSNFRNWAFCKQTRRSSFPVIHKKLNKLRKTSLAVVSYLSRKAFSRSLRDYP